MIEKLAALLHYEELNSVEYRTDWLSEDESSLINMIDVIKQNADGTYDVTGAREMFEFYHQFDAGNTDYAAAAGMWATNGAGVERLLDFEIAQAADPVQYMFSLIAPSSMASMRYENHHWSPEQIYDQIHDYRARYDAAAATGDLDAQQQAAADLDVFLRSVNPYLSSGARNAHIQLMLGNTGTNPDKYSLVGTQNSTHLATAFDDDGNLMPGTVDLSLPLEQQQQQLAAHLQQQGWSASNAAQFATEYYSPRIQARDDGEFNDYFVNADSKPVIVAGLGTVPVDLRSADAIVDEIEINIANGGYRSKESIQGSIDAAYDAFLRLAQRLDKDPSAVSTADEERQAQRLLQAVRTLGQQARDRGVELDPVYTQMVRGLQSSAASEAAWGVYGNGGGGNGYLSARQATRARQPLDPAQLEKLSTKYAELVNSNSKWEWNQIGQLTRTQQSAIRQAAIDRGLIPNVPNKPTGHPDFNAVPGLVRDVQTLPQGLWGLSDRAQFSYLDSMIGGRPAGYTWHHSEISGRMELIPFGVHRAYGHDGGRAPGMWAYRPGGR